jgi:hypothetical protein
MHESDAFVHTFADSLVDRSGLQLAQPVKERYVTQLEQAIHQRLGIATCERLGEERMQHFVKDFLEGTPTQQLTRTLRDSFGMQSRFIEQELTAFAAEFLQAVRSH